MHLKRYVAVAALTLVSVLTLAQERTGAVPVLLEYFEVTRDYDTGAMARMMHPEALSRFRETIDAALQGPKSELAKAQLLPLFNVTTVEDFRELTNVDAYRRMNDVIARSAPELISMMTSSSYEIVGEINREGIAYVTYLLTMSVQGREVETEVVQKLKQHEGKWLLLLPSSADATIAGIEAQLL